MNGDATGFKGREQPMYLTGENTEPFLMSISPFPMVENNKTKQRWLLTLITWLSVRSKTDSPLKWSSTHRENQDTAVGYYVPLILPGPVFSAAGANPVSPAYPLSPHYWALTILLVEAKFIWEDFVSCSLVFSFHVHLELVG